MSETRMDDCAERIDADPGLSPHDAARGVTRRDFIKGAAGTAIALSAPFVITSA